jgi:hypothetical protein
MHTNERQIALSVLEGLRGDLIYAHLNNGSRVLDVADLRQYIYEQMGRIRTNALAMDGLYGNGNGNGNGNDNGNGQDISKSNGHDANRTTDHSVAHSHPGEFAMSHLTLQEVIERINQNQASREGPANHGQSHH